MSTNTPVALRANYADFYGSTALPAVDEIFWSTIAQYPGIREKIFQVKSMDRDIVQYTEMHDMPLFTQMSEGTEYTYNRPRQGANKTYTALKYGNGFSISDEAVKDGKHDMIADMARKLAKSARETQEISGMNVLNNGFSSTVTTPDGQNLFATAHVLPSGLTFRNKLSTDADLSQASLDLALEDFATQNIGDTGIIEMIRPRVLLVPTGRQERYARELVGSTLKPDSMDNNLNSLQGEGLVVMSSPHLTDADAWFLLATPSETGLRLYIREAMQTKSEPVFSNDSIRYKAMYREVLGASHPKGIYGSQGA